MKHPRLFMFALALSLMSPHAFASEAGGSSTRGLITPNYGIVTDDDLAYDASRQKIPPYAPGTSSLYWQCLPAKQVRLKYQTSRGSDPMGLANVIVTMCEPEITVHRDGELHIYVDRRGHPVEHCHEMARQWHRLTKNESIVCLNGDGSNLMEDPKLGKYFLWTWEKFKTRKGCYSYFGGTCDTEGCSKGKCPQ